jgi:DNA polymerase-3 subunit epsilon
MTTYYLDTETTGLFDAEFVECSIVDAAGRTVLDTLCHPGRPIPAQASAIHGISDADVAGMVPAETVRRFVLDLVRGHDVVIYNAQYDCQFFPGIRDHAASVHCCMLDFAELFGQWDDYREGWKWQKLDAAARHVKHTWTGAAHRALADALAARSVHLWCIEQRRRQTSAEPAA